VVVTRAHVEDVVGRYCAAETAHDRDTWLSLDPA
jgi:hypothetical protein